MKKIIYVLTLPMVITGGLVFASLTIKKEDDGKVIRHVSKTESIAERKRWEASPDGLTYNRWKASPVGKKVFASAAKINDEIKNHEELEAVITSLSLPAGAALGFGMMVKIKGEDFILCFRPEDPSKNFLPYNNEFKHLYGLKVNDKITIKTGNVMHAPKYSFPILWGNYVKLGNSVIYHSITRNDGC